MKARHGGGKQRAGEDETSACTVNGASATDHTILEAATVYAGRGWRVLPVEPGEKKPLGELTPHGVHSATADEDHITGWFTARPDANIAIACGAVSEMIVVDVDEDRGGLDTLEHLETEHGPLPNTYTVQTGGNGGQHYYFELPSGVEVPSRNDPFGVGIEIKARGTYVLAPPSHVNRPYRVRNNAPLAPVPEWLLRVLRQPKESESRSTPPEGSRFEKFGDEPSNLDYGPIYEGERNTRLTRIAGRLHDGRDLDRLITELLEVNEARCSPPLPAGEVEQIAASVFKTWPCKRSGPWPDRETLKALDVFAEAVEFASWPGKAKKSERDVLVALVKMGREHSAMIPTGIRTSVSVRSLAMLSGVAKSSLTRKDGVVQRLKIAGWLRGDNAERSGTEAGNFVLVLDRAHLTHSSPTESLSSTEKTSGSAVRAPYSAWRLRWSVPDVLRLGKTGGQVLDALEHAGGELTLKALADAVGSGRVRDLRRRTVARLEAAGVVEVSGESVALTPGWLNALSIERERAGEVAALRRDLRRYEEDRRLYRHRCRGYGAEATKPEPTEAESEATPENNALERRRKAIQQAVNALFDAKPEYRERRVGQIVCKLHPYLPRDFPRDVGLGGHPKDAEVAEVLEIAA